MNIPQPKPVSPQDLEYQKRIAWGQAMNCAVEIASTQSELLIVSPEDELGDEKMEKLILNWRDWFYEELMKPYYAQPKSDGKVDKIDSKQKAKEAAELDTEALLE